MTSTTLTIASNHFSDPEATIPHTGLPGAQDGEWFRANDVYEGNIAGIIWNEGDQPNAQSITISARAGSILTITPNLTATSIKTNLDAGVDTWISLAPYNSAAVSPRQLAYAHIADNGSPPELDGNKAKEYR
jgi:hypothetical protein